MSGCSMNIVSFACKRVQFLEKNSSNNFTLHQCCIFSFPDEAAQSATTLGEFVRNGIIEGKIYINLLQTITIIDVS